MTPLNSPTTYRRASRRGQVRSRSSTGALTPHLMSTAYTGRSPGAFLFANGWRASEDLAKACLSKARKRMKKWADCKRRHVEYEVGDLVMAPSPHLSQLRTGTQSLTAEIRRAIPDREEDWQGRLSSDIAKPLGDAPCLPRQLFEAVPRRRRRSRARRVQASANQRFNRAREEGGVHPSAPSHPKKRNRSSTS